MYVQFLAEHVCSNTLVQEDRQCLSLVLDAMTYHAVPQQRASFPSSRSVCPRKSTVGVLFAIGGMDSVKGLLGVTSCVTGFIVVQEYRLTFRAYVMCQQVRHALKSMTCAPTPGARWAT